MRIIARRRLREFWSNHADAEQPLRAWYATARRAEWLTPQDIKNAYRRASFVADNRVIFNIGGNNYRLVARVDYQRSIIYIRFLGTHQAYDDIDATTI